MGTANKKWLGGYVRQGKRGQVFVIERWIRGVHWHVSTKCRTERAALKELERFEADPKSYRTAREEKTQGLEVTPELIDEHLRWMRALNRDAGHIREREFHLTQLMLALEGRDLRRVTLSELSTMLDEMGEKGRWNRVKCVKAFATWLRKHKKVLPRAEDPTLDLLNPVPKPEKTRRKKAMTVELVEMAIDLMDAEIRDVAILLAATGLHIREARRFHGGDGELFEPPDWQRAEGVLANLMVRHKSGKPHVVALTAQAVVDAAKRIKAREKFPSPSAIYDSDVAISSRLQTRFRTGSLRHSVASWLAMGRVSEQDIANQLGHASTKMVHNVYVDLGMTAKPLPIPHLKLLKG